MVFAQIEGQGDGGVADLESEQDVKGVGGFRECSQVGVFQESPENLVVDVAVHVGAEQGSEDRGGIVESCLGVHNEPSGVEGWCIGSAAARWDL